MTLDDAVKVLNREGHLGYKSWAISEEGWVFTGGVKGRLLMPSHAIAIATGYEAGKEELEPVVLSEAAAFDFLSRMEGPSGNPALEAMVAKARENRGKETEEL